jgi:hypothetical protein
MGKRSTMIHLIQKVMGIHLKQLVQMDDDEIKLLYLTACSYEEGEETA